jgi:hypothetical protein
MSGLSWEQLDENRRNRNWKKLSSSQKHYTLMYFYRLKTDAKDIHLYIESHCFLKMAINPYDNLPRFVVDSTPMQLLEEAYGVLSKSPPQYLKNEASKYPLKFSNILPFTKMPEDELEIIKSYLGFIERGVSEKSISGLSVLAKKLMRKYPNHLVQIQYEKERQMQEYDPKDIA